MKMTDVRCTSCGSQREVLVRADGTLGVCRDCQADTVEAIPFEEVAVRANVIGDDIPGGVVIKNGICWPDGTPRRYDSKSSMRKEEVARGVFRIEDQVPVLNEQIERSLAKHKSQAPRIVAIPAILTPEAEAERKAHWRANASPEELVIIDEQASIPDRIVIGVDVKHEATRRIVENAVRQAARDGRI